MRAKHQVTDPKVCQIKRSHEQQQQSQDVYIVPVNFIHGCALIMSLALALNGLEKALEPLAAALLRHLSPVFLA